MCNKIETVVISSDEEDDDEVVFVKEIRASASADEKVLPNYTLHSDVSSNFSVSISKLKALKLKQAQDRSRDACNGAIRKCMANKSDENHSCRGVKKLSSSKSKDFRINHAKLKKLKAIINIELERPNNMLERSVKIEEEDVDDDILPECTTFTSTKNEEGNAVCSSQVEPSPLQPFVQKPSPKTPQATQSTLEDFVMRTERKKQLFASPSLNINARRNELVWPPDHYILNSEKFIKMLYPGKELQDFSSTYTYILESLQDEDLHISFIQAVYSFMNKDFGPSSELIRYLVEDILSSSSETQLVSVTYCLLYDILERYPTKCIDVKITWQDLKKYFVHEKESNDNEKSLKKPGRELALSFLVSVLSVELKTTALKSKGSRLRKNFSSDFSVRPVKLYVIPYLKQCLQNHTASPKPACEILNNCSWAKDGDLSRPEANSVCGLALSQDVLKLCMIASSDKENAAMRLAEELLLLYIDLDKLKQRVLLLQSIKSHHVRVQLLKVLLMNYCALRPEALQGNNLPLCVRRILLQDFRRLPPKRCDEDVHSVEAVEEYVTFLAYLLQSYIVIHEPSLHAHHNDQPLLYHDDVEEFSAEDRSYLNNIKFDVLNLRERCCSVLGGEKHLSVRSIILLRRMEIIKLQ